MRNYCVIVNVRGFDGRLSVLTVMVAVPAAVIRLAGTAAVNWVTVWNVVVRSVLTKSVVVALGTVQTTFELVVKLAPLTIIVNAEPPAFTLVGSTLVITTDDAAGFGFTTGI